jgi:F-type H+-transporting ATPase subunit delta
MSIGTLARRYARAILSLASEQGQAAQVGTELQEFAKGWTDSDDLRGLFANPSFDHAARKAVLEELAQRAGMSPLGRNSIMYLADHNRLFAVADIARAYAELAEKASGNVRAEVTSAAPLTEAYYTQLQKALEQVTGQKVSIDRKTDPALIAGVVTKVGDKVFDGSIRTRLSELKESLTGA